MRTRSIPYHAVGLLVGVLTVLPLGCERKLPSAFIVTEAPLPTPETFNLAVAITRGNNTYLPVNAVSYGPVSQVRILELIAAFEQAHPELEVSCFDVDQASNGTTTHTSGLWLHHLPKPKT